MRENLDSTAPSSDAVSRAMEVAVWRILTYRSGPQFQQDVRVMQRGGAIEVTRAR